MRAPRRRGCLSFSSSCLAPESSPGSLPLTRSTCSILPQSRDLPSLPGRDMPFRPALTKAWGWGGLLANKGNSRESMLLSVKVR